MGATVMVVRRRSHCRQTTMRQCSQLREKVKVDATMDEGYVGFARPRSASGTKAHIGVANTGHDMERAPTMCQCLRRQQERPP